jgi:FMN phosphatase YigB (HAD superfamily)
VKSCDEIGVGKPLGQVYETAKQACDVVEEGSLRERWFVAAHMWDLAAARKAGYVSIAGEEKANGSRHMIDSEQVLYWLNNHPWTSLMIGGNSGVENLMSGDLTLKRLSKVY